MRMNNLAIMSYSEMTLRVTRGRNGSGDGQARSTHNRYEGYGRNNGQDQGFGGNCYSYAEQRDGGNHRDWSGAEPRFYAFPSQYYSVPTYAEMMHREGQQPALRTYSEMLHRESGGKTSAERYPDYSASSKYKRYPSNVHGQVDTLSRAEPGWSELNAVFDSSGAHVLRAAAYYGNPNWGYSGLNGGHGEGDKAAIHWLLYNAMQYTPESVLHLLKQNYGVEFNAADYGRSPALFTGVLDRPEQNYPPN
jgi:hypothetical protein